ncbi:MAG TPA: glycosyltransferase [Ohtaekwangia sp.]|nr:glycosyltransferase [Ohtaekwangia sp.]
MQPLVSVICLCYNHARFVTEAILSVRQQSYAAVELIVVDDASTDNSVDKIRQAIAGLPAVKLITFRENAGMCKAFNAGLALAKGDYIIDLAADDVLLPDRILAGVQAFQRGGVNMGMNFTDAENIDEDGHHIAFHSDRFPHSSIPQGDVYLPLINRYFISSPTMMFSRILIDRLGGYDEDLDYEDFDLWIRGSREFEFRYTPTVLVKRRIVKNSMARRQFTRLDRQRHSTYDVCCKIMKLNRNRAEQQALTQRIYYEIIQCFKVLDWHLAYRYALLWQKNRAVRYER